jgi:hypothetical protein
MTLRVSNRGQGGTRGSWIVGEFRVKSGCASLCHRMPQSGILQNKTWDKKRVIAFVGKFPDHRGLVTLSRIRKAVYAYQIKFGNAAPLRFKMFYFLACYIKSIKIKT